MKYWHLLIAAFIVAPPYLVLQAQQVPTNAPAPVKVAAPPLGVPPSIHGTEDLRSLVLDKSSMHAAAPLAGETDNYPEFTRELLQVQWRAGDPIDLYVIKPRGTKNPPVVIYVYSYPSETDRFRDNEYCKRLTASGYAAVGFVSALTGQRYHDRPMREWFVSKLPEALAMSVHDVQMVLQYLSERGDVDMARVGIFGSGSGATIAILAATIEPQIRAVDALQPWGDWPDWLAKSTLIPETERAAYLRPEFLASVAPFDPVRWVGRVQAKSLRLQLVLDDPVTPLAAVQHIKTAAPPSAQVLEYPSKRDQYQVLGGGRAFDWIKDRLRVPNSPSESTQAINQEPKAQNERPQEWVGNACQQKYRAEGWEWLFCCCCQHR